MIEVAQIDFDAGGCYGTCPIFKMKITGAGTAEYKAELFNELEGEFDTVIKPAQLNRLIRLIEKANIFELERNYLSDETCQPTYTLKVKLKNRRTKTIRDNGPNGPDELQKIYRFIFSLRNTQDWNKTVLTQ